MRLTNIQLDGFGVLAGIRFEELGPGLNVIWGPNGSGKTTLIHFLRGILNGFADARSLRLLPPLSGGKPGGSFGIAHGERRYTLVRQALPDRSDRLAITVRRGELSDATTIRRELESAEPVLIRMLFACTAPRVEDLTSLLKQAEQDGIPIVSQGTESRSLDRSLQAVVSQRLSMTGGADGQGRIGRLKACLRQVCSEVTSLECQLKGLREGIDRRIENWQTRERQARGERNRLDEAWQAAMSDLQQAQENAWRQTVGEQRPSSERLPVDDAWLTRLEEIDQQITRGRQMLKDLAGRRARIDGALAEISSVESTPLDAICDKQQRALARIETILAEAESLSESSSEKPRRCHCRELRNRLEKVIRSIRVEAAELCAAISRQRLIAQAQTLRQEQTEINRCAEGLGEHIRFLLQRREDHLAAAPDPSRARVRFAIPEWHENCVCREVMTGPVEGASGVGTIPMLRERCRQLHGQLRHAHNRWREILRQRPALSDAERDELLSRERELSEKQLEAKALQAEIDTAEQESRTLSVVEAGLRKMQETLPESLSAPVIQTASEMLKRLTGGRYNIIIVKAPDDVCLVNDSQVAVRLDSLSHGTLEQLGLCLRLALSEAYARQGLDLPLVFDEVLSDCDHEVQCRAVDLLQETARRRQIIYLTCQTHLAALFQSQGASVSAFPGYQWQSPTVEETHRQDETNPPAPPSVEPAGDPSQESVTAASVSSGEPIRATRSVRVVRHPAEKHWLRADSPVSSIPSLGAQMARRLGASGVRTVADLIELDLEESEMPLQGLQISASRFRIWQAEARLLCCVPDLTGDAAQLLVACGIFSPRELAEADADALLRKINRLRGHGESGAMVPDFVWPDRQSLGHWIAQGGAARTFRAAREACQGRSRGGGSFRDRVGRRHFSTRRSGLRRQRVDQASKLSGPRTQAGSRGSRRQTHSLSVMEPSADQARQEISVSREEVSSSGSVAPEVSREESAPSLRFYLELSSPVVDAPSIGPTTAKRLEKIGITTVADLLNRDAQQTAEKLQHRRVHAGTIRRWQDQARLMCQIPEIRGHDSQVLIACGIKDPEEIAQMSPQALFGIVGPFVATKEGQRLLRSSKTPDLSEVTDWITWAQQSRKIKAA